MEQPGKHKKTLLDRIVLTCEEATMMIVQQEEQVQLGPKQRFQLYIHLGICKFCKMFQQQNHVISEAARNSQRNRREALSGEAKEKMQQALNQKLGKKS